MAFDLGELLKDVSESGTGREQIEYIRMDLIEEDPNNFYNLSDIENLASNIALCGLQQPIRVRAIDGSGKYRIVSGHRRRAAVEELRKDDPERWAEVACIIEQDEASPALQQLRLIYANANTRTMTSAEVSEQAVQVEKLLYQLKEDGYEFPGRMRDHVAQAVGQSKSKLARLKMIRDNLAAAWQADWKSGELGESTAYELSRIPKAWQSLLFEEKSRTGAKIKYLYADDVKKFYERVSKIEQMTCTEHGGSCESYELKARKAAVSDRWGWFHCDNKCCRDCPELIRCKSACPKLKDLVQKLKADAKEAARQEAAAKAERDAPFISQINAIWQRFGLARKLAEKSFEDCKKIMDMPYFPYAGDLVIGLERGEVTLSAGTKLPLGNIYRYEADRLIRLADLLGCSLDYLFCRTDVRETATAQEAVPNSGTGWQAGSPVAYGTYAAYVRIKGVGDPMLRKLLWDGEEWFLFGDKLNEDVTVLYWSELPAL